MYAIVDDATYSNVKGDEKSVGVLKFDKDPSKEFPGYKGVEASQLVKLKSKTKSFAKLNCTPIVRHSLTIGGAVFV